MTNYTIRFYGVQFLNGRNVKNMDEVVESISEQEYNDLVEGDCDTFFNAFGAIRKRVEKRLGFPIQYIVDWDAVTVWHA